MEPTGGVKEDNPKLQQERNQISEIANICDSLEKEKVWNDIPQFFVTTIEAEAGELQ